jgi:hypothetical protein
VHVIVSPKVSSSLGALQLPRELLLKVLFAVHHTLPSNYDRIRKNREVEDPDLFDYAPVIFDGEQWHRLRFSVNDTRATGFLFIDAVSSESWDG